MEITISIIAVYLLSHTSSIGPPTIPTALHGGTEGNPGQTWSTSPVNAILSWDEITTGSPNLHWDEAVSNFKFTHSDGTTSSVVGTHTGATCTPVALAAGEYINAYEVNTAQPLGDCSITQIYVYGVAFRTNLGNEFSCGQALNGCDGTEASTGWITYEGYFLGGVNWRGGDIVDAIGFCFVREDLVGAEGLSCDPPPSCSDRGYEFGHQHACQCQRECGDKDVDRFCNPLSAVAGRLNEDIYDYELCGNPEETCCCSCENCNGFEAVPR